MPSVMFAVKSITVSGCRCAGVDDPLGDVGSGVCSLNDTLVTFVVGTSSGVFDAAGCGTDGSFQVASDALITFDAI